MTEAEILAALKKILFPPSSMFDESGQERILDYQINPDGTISVAAMDGIKQIGALIDVDKGRIKSRILNPEQVDPTYKKEFAAVELAIEVWEMTGVLPVDELATFAAKGSKSATPKQCKKQRCGNSCISVNKICDRGMTVSEKNMAEGITSERELSKLENKFLEDRLKQYKEDGSYKKMALGFPARNYEDIAATDGIEAAETALIEAVRRRAKRLAIEYLQKQEISSERDFATKSKDEILLEKLAAFDRLHKDEAKQQTLKSWEASNPEKAANLLAEYRKELQKDEAFSYESIMDRGSKFSAPIKNRLVEASDLGDKYVVMNAFRNALIVNGLTRDQASSVVNAKRFDVSIDSSSLPIAKGVVTEFYQMTGGIGSKTLDEFVSIKSRASANKYTKKIDIGRNLSSETIYHELGHHIEFEDDRIARAAEKWRDARSTGTPQRLKDIMPGSGFDDSEIAVPGKFIHPYVGKIYSDGATEVISMGIEAFSSTTGMLKLWEAAPDHFNFILGIIKRPKNL